MIENHAYVMERMRDGDYSNPDLQLATWNVTEDRLHFRYFPANFLKFLITTILIVVQLSSAAC